jgi:hypothetical protein
MFAPYYRPRTSYVGLQNTDPFVFGDHFHYAGCQQYRKGHPTQLQRLPRGSIVLFGSCVGRTSFVLDTLLVVDRSIEHSYLQLDSVQQQVSRTYADVTLRPWYAGIDAGFGGDPNTCYRLYWGATPTKPVEGMFSFFPALLEQEAPNGFPRPTIRIDGAITNHLSQGFKVTPASAELIESWWKRIRDQVYRQGLRLGTAADLPDRRGAAPADPRAGLAECGSRGEPKRSPAPVPAAC